MPPCLRRSIAFYFVSLILLQPHGRVTEKDPRPPHVYPSYCGLGPYDRDSYACGGMKGYWRGRLAVSRAKQSNVSLFELAQIYGHLGEKDRAFEYLEKMCAERSPYILNFKVQPEFDSLRSDPRYEDLLRRVGLP